MLVGVGFGSTRFGGLRVRGPGRRATSCWRRRCGTGLHARWRWEASVLSFERHPVVVEYAPSHHFRVLMEPVAAAAGPAPPVPGPAPPAEGAAAAAPVPPAAPAKEAAVAPPAAPAKVALAELVQCVARGWRGQDMLACAWCKRVVAHHIQSRLRWAAGPRSLATGFGGYDQQAAAHSDVRRPKFTNVYELQYFAGQQCLHSYTSYKQQICLQQIQITKVRQ